MFGSPSSPPSRLASIREESEAADGLRVSVQSEETKLQNKHIKGKTNE